MSWFNNRSTSVSLALPMHPEQKASLLESSEITKMSKGIEEEI
jgi:hypothetical protein